MSLIKANFMPTRRDLRLFGGLWLPLLLALIGGVLYFKSGRQTAGVILAGLAGLISILGWLNPDGFRLVFLCWMGLTWPIGWIVSHLVLLVAYYGLFTLTGLVLRLCGHDPLSRSFDKNARSYWTPYSPSRGRDRYFRQF